MFGVEERAPKSFKFVAFWLRDDTCFNVVHAAWAKGRGTNPACVLVQKIHATRTALHRWNHKQFGHIPSSIKHLKEQLSICQNASPIV